MLSAARLPQVQAEACISLQASWGEVKFGLSEPYSAN